MSSASGGTHSRACAPPMKSTGVVPPFVTRTADTRRPSCVGVRQGRARDERRVRGGERAEAVLDLADRRGVRHQPSPPSGSGEVAAGSSAAGSSGSSRVIAANSTCALLGDLLGRHDELGLQAALARARRAPRRSRSRRPARCRRRGGWRSCARSRVPRLRRGAASPRSVRLSVRAASRDLLGCRFRHYPRDRLRRLQEDGELVEAGHAGVLDLAALAQRARQPRERGGAARELDRDQPPRAVRAQLGEPAPRRAAAGRSRAGSAPRTRRCCGRRRSARGRASASSRRGGG